MNDAKQVLSWITANGEVSWNAIGAQFAETIGAQKAVNLAGALLLLGLLYRADGDGVMPATVGAVDGALVEMHKREKTARFKRVLETCSQ